MRTVSEPEVNAKWAQGAVPLDAVGSECSGAGGSHGVLGQHRRPPPRLAAGEEEIRS